MAKLNAFLFISLDGYFKGTNNDISWHVHGGEESEFSADSLKSGNTLLFGRVTYEMMVSFWTTPEAKQTLPVVAEGMNKSTKIVFSNTLKSAEWQNTKVVSGNIVEQVRKMKALPGNDMTILGSGSIVSLFTDAGLIDTYQIMIDPVAIGKGIPIFNGIRNKFNLKLTGSRIFKSGVVLLNYEPEKS